MRLLFQHPPTCEVRSVIKILDAQSIALIEIRQLYQVYVHTRLDGRHISCRSSVGRCLIIHRIARALRPVISNFSCTSRNSCPVWVFGMTGGDECHSGSNPRRQTSTTQDTILGPTVWETSQFRRWICWKIAQYLQYLFKWILQLNWGLFPRET